MRQLLSIITETVNTLFPVLNFLECVVTEVVYDVIDEVKAYEVEAYRKVCQFFGPPCTSAALLLQHICP